MPSRDLPRLDGGLIARKGEAAPSAPPMVQEIMSAMPTISSGPSPSAKSTAGTIAVTVRLDPERYQRLKMHGAVHRITNQDILVEALDCYLSEKTRSDGHVA